MRFKKFDVWSRCFDSSGNSFIVAPREILCFDSSPSVGEKTAVVNVFVAISRIEIQASWSSPGWSISRLWVSAKNGKRGASEGSAQLSSAHWSAQETPSMGTHQGVQASPCGGNLLIKPDKKKNRGNIWYPWGEITPACGFTKRFYDQSDCWGVGYSIYFNISLTLTKQRKAPSAGSVHWARYSMHCYLMKNECTLINAAMLRQYDNHS